MELLQVQVLAPAQDTRIIHFLCGCKSPSSARPLRRFNKDMKHQVWPQAHNACLTNAYFHSIHLVTLSVRDPYPCHQHLTSLHASDLPGFLLQVFPFLHVIYVFTESCPSCVCVCFWDTVS